MNDFDCNHIRVNLSNIARKVIENDSILFGASSNSKLTFGSLINRIIQNFDDDFEVNEDYLALRSEGQGKLVYLQGEVVDILNGVRLSGYLRNVASPTVPKFVKCLLESFARLPFIEQEKLILKNDIIKPICAAIENRKRLRLRFKGETMELTPISIAPAKEGTFQYLIGLADENLKSIRLSRIEKVKLIGKADRTPEKLKAKIDEDLSEFGPTFIMAPPVTIKVRFTDNGLDSYKYTVMHRPMHCAIEEGNVYVFQCSEMQALYFFFRFAGDAEILEPQSLRDKFRDLYQAGLNKNR